LSSCKYNRNLSNDITPMTMPVLDSEWYLSLAKLSNCWALLLAKIIGKYMAKIEEKSLIILG